MQINKIFLKSRNIIITDYKTGERFVKLLKLGNYTKKYNAFSVTFLNNRILLYNDQIDYLKQYYYILSELYKLMKQH